MLVRQPAERLWASDAVAKISALLANGQTLPAALHDNVFAVAVPVVHPPARVVAYDRSGTVIGASEPIRNFGGGANAAPGKAVETLAAKAGVAHAELFVRTRPAAANART